MLNNPTPYPEINEILTLLLTRVKAVLGKQFTGMYLYGSLSSGDFDLTSSDIDFAIVTEDILPQKTIVKLESMHQEIWQSGLKWAAKLEGSYLPKDLMRRHNPNGPACPTVNEGSFFLDQRGSDWILQRHIIRECGIVVNGPAPKTLIDPVSPADIRQAILGLLDEWWFPMLSNPTWLRERGSEYHAYAVISMCRALHGIKHGIIASKPAAARWAQTEYNQWHMLIEKSIATQAGTHPGFADEALAFISFCYAKITT